MPVSRFTRHFFVSLLFLVSLNLHAQSWFLTAGHMHDARANQTATVLQNGQVLVAGGRFRGNFQDNTAELYNPSTNTFGPTGNLITGRNSHAAALLPSGEVLIVGGEHEVGNSIQCISSAELYNPSTGAFSAAGNTQVAHCDTTAVLINTGNVLITDGKTAELYNPNTGTFSLTGSPNVIRGAYALALLENGNVLIAGGQGSSGAYLTSAEVYNPSTGKFTLTGSMNAQRTFFTLTSLPNGDVLAAGGQAGAPNFTILNSAELYSPTTGKFTATGSLNTARCAHAALLLPSGEVLIAAGVAASPRETTTSAELYNASTGSFGATGDLNDPREFHQLVLLQTGVPLVDGGNSNVNGDLFFWNTAELFE
jgi:WD40 repeat protein